MGFFGSKKESTNGTAVAPAATAPGAHYEYRNMPTTTPTADNHHSLPVATPIEAFVVSAAPPPKKTSVTTTTVYAPDGSIQKQPHITTAFPQSQTFITHIPAPNNNNHHNNNNNVQEMLLPGFRRAPARLQSCPSCRQQGTRTRTRTHPTIMTWVACFILVVLFWPICWIPLVTDSFKQTDHYCSSCGVKVGEVAPLQDCCEKRRG